MLKQKVRTTSVFGKQEKNEGFFNRRGEREKLEGSEVEGMLLQPICKVRGIFLRRGTNYPLPIPTLYPQHPTVRVSRGVRGAKAMGLELAGKL